MGKVTVVLTVKREKLNLPPVGLRCEVLRVRQLVRMMVSPRTRKHLNFWLGKSLDCNLLDEEWFVLRKGVSRGAKPVVITSPYFQKWAALFRKARTKGVVDIDELDTVTTRGMYAEWLSLQDEPEIVREEADKPWGTVWTRVASGLVVDEAINPVYLLAHNRLGTRERGHRLMPDKFKTNVCPNCEKEVETVDHRYVTCEWVASLWAWTAGVLVRLDDSLDRVPVMEVLRFQFQKGLREAAVVWMLASYIAIINREVLLKGRKLGVGELAGLLKHAKSKMKLEAVQDVGPIPWE